MIQTAVSSKEILTKIAQLLPGMKLSMVEYAVDIHCRDFVGTELLFWILRRNVYVPYADKSMLFGGQEVAEGRMSLACRIVQIKFHERGKDKDKVDIPGTDNKGWLHNRLDRIRLEFTAEGYILKQKGLKTLENLIRSPKFQEIFKKRIKFIKFRDTVRRFPRYWEGYSAKDSNKNSGAFHDEYVKTYNAGVNPSQYLKADDTLCQLNDRIQAKISQFDSDWPNQPG